MKWKTIGNSVKGTSHLATGKNCEDAIQYRVVTDGEGKEILLCCASDGAGSAKYAVDASFYTTRKIIDGLADPAFIESGFTETGLYSIVEHIYAGLTEGANDNGVALNEYSCTLLGCFITADKAAFFQVGDGAIVRNDGSGFYTPVWWPQNGEYQNATSFLVDDPTFSNLKITILNEAVNEVAIFTDGLQMLALNMEASNAHQPFFTPLFNHLQMADDEQKINVLNRKLEEFLNSAAINDRTDDDKTLFLATRLPA